MAHIAEIKIEPAFADDTKREIKIGPFDAESDAITNLKENVKAFNAEEIAGLYLSEGGATCTGIGAATIYETDEKEIYLAVED